MRKDSKLEGLHHEILMDWITSEKTENLDPEIAIYLTQLDKCRGWRYSLKSENFIIKALMAEYPNLTRTAAKTRYVNAMNYFYVDIEIKQDAYINMYAEDLDNVKNLILQTSKTPEQAVLAVKPIKEAIILRGILKEKAQELPTETFDYSQIIYVMDPKKIQKPEADRNKIAAQIKGFINVSEKDINRVEEEAGLKPLDVKRVINPNE